MSEYFCGYDISANKFPLKDDVEKCDARIEFPLFKTYWMVKDEKFEKKKKKKDQRKKKKWGPISVVFVTRP